MEVSFAQISRQPAIVPARPVYLVYGREQALVDEVLAKLIAGVRHSAHGDPEVQVLYGSAATADQVALELANLSLMSAAKVVVLRDASQMKAAEQTRLAALIPRLGAGALLVLAAGEPTYDSKSRRTKVLHDKLELVVREAGVVIEVPAFREQDAEEWVLATARAAGLQMDPRAAAQMVLLAGADLTRLRHELQKVALYAGESRTVSVEDVQQVTSRSPEATVFELVDAIGDRRPDQALEALKILLDAGEPEQRILALIARQVRLIWQAKYLAENGYLRRSESRVPREVVQDLLPREASLSVMGQVQRPFLREKLIRQAAAFTWDGLRRSLERVLQADLALKGIEGEVDNPRLVLEMLVLELASGRRRTATSEGARARA